MVKEMLKSICMFRCTSHILLAQPCNDMHIFQAQCSPKQQHHQQKNKHTLILISLIWILVCRLHKLVAVVFRLKAHSTGKAAAAAAAVQATLAFQYIDCYRCC